MCLIRRKLIQLTPEEKVRQSILSFFLEDLKIPKELIEVEYPLVRSQKGAKGRADIIVFDINGYSLLIVECKAENIMLDKKAIDQLMKYDQVMGSDYLLLTNGIENHSVMYDYENKEYKTLTKILTFKEMINNNYEILEYKKQEFSRITKEQILNLQYIKENYNDIIGEDTPKSLYKPILRFWEALQYEDIMLNSQQTKKVKITEDLGVVPFSFGNASGGTWEGFYRGFLVETFEKNKFTVYITILSSAKTLNHQHYGNRLGQSTLIVAIDDGIKSHNSLQLSLNLKYVKKNKNNFVLTHKGDATAGKNGRIPRKIVYSKVAEIMPEICLNEDIELGTFEIKEDLNILDIESIICNLVDYAIIRDEVRKTFVKA